MKHGSDRVQQHVGAAGNMASDGDERYNRGCRWRLGGMRYKNDRVGMSPESNSYRPLHSFDCHHGWFTAIDETGGIAQIG